MLSTVILSWKRPEWVHEIIDSIRHSGFIDEIVVWNNNKDISYSNANARVVNCQEDFGLFTRFTASTLCKNEAVLFLDDDMLVEVETLLALFQEWRKFPGVLHGVCGRNLTYDKQYKFGDDYGQVPIVLTKCVITTRSICRQVLACQEWFRDLPGTPVGNGEDIIMSYVAMDMSKKQFNMSHKFPWKERGLAGDGIFMLPGHKEHRTKIVRRCLDIFKKDIV